MTHDCNNCGEEATVHKYDEWWCFSCFVGEVLNKARSRRW